MPESLSAIATILDRQSASEQLTDPLFPSKTAAEYIGVTKQTLAVWRCNKRYEIPYIKVGRLVKYRKSALDTFLNDRTCGQ